MGEGFFMNCCITDLTRKEVINLRNGNSLGNIGDVEVNTHTGQLVAVVLYPRRLMPFFSKCDEFRICWDDIKVIGDDTVLVDVDDTRFFPPDMKKNGFDIFRR
jgi:YlmC/YmxH family sporulation protein